MLLLTNYRPEYQERWGAKTYYTRLRIDPLPSQDADDFLEVLLGDAFSLMPLKQLLKERTGGNPFFLEESVRVLVETQALEGRPGAYELVHSLDDLQMPATIQAILAARIDRLPHKEKQLLQAAAVIGTDVPLILLLSIADQPDDEVRRGLAHLQSAEFLYESRLFPDPEYTFKHALTHEVAYSGLLHERRRQLHQRVGLAIEASYPDRLIELAEMLANQFERGEDWPKAVHYLLRITEKVKGQHAYERAAEFCSRALEITAKVSELVDERVRGGVLLGDVWSLLGDIEQANQSYEQALLDVTEPTAREQIANRLHRQHTTVHNGATIAYYEHGSGEHTLVLVHPVMYGLAVFQPVVEKLCQEFRIITIDPRGRGASDSLPGTYPLTEHVEDICAVIEACSADKPVTGLGFSRGGTLMMMLAASYPNLLQKLVVMSSHASPTQTYAQMDWIEEIRDLLKKGDKEQAFRLWATRRHSEPGSEYLIEQFVLRSVDVSSEAALKFYTPDPEDDVADLLPHIPVPTLVIHGTEDGIVPIRFARYIAEHIAGAQFYGCKGIGHGALHTATSEICEVLRCFIQTGTVPEGIRVAS
jgi:pimeloyl-ACP methyl ester carboxylesterase